jgi:hypothetical protein
VCFRWMGLSLLRRRIEVVCDNLYLLNIQYLVCE